MHRGHRGVVALACWLVGCVGSYGSAVIPHPLRSGTVAANTVRVPDELLDEEIVGLPDGHLTREASLAVLDGQRACFDLTLRLMGGSGPHVDWNLDALTERKMRVTLEVDGGDPLDPRRPFSSWQVRSEPRRHVGAGRVCFDTAGHVGRDSKELGLFVMFGAYELGFFWQLAAADGAGPGPAPEAGLLQRSP